MRKALIHQVTRVVAIIMFGLSVLINLPEVAQAAQAVTFSSLDNTTDVVNVVTIYPTTEETQPMILSEVSKGEASTFSEDPGFQDSVILRSQDGQRVVALSQWSGKDRSSFQVYAQAHILSIPAGESAQSFACQVQHTETRTESLAFQPGDVMMFSQFKMKPDRDQADLAMIIT